MFATLIDTLTHQGCSIHAYKEVTRQALIATRSDPENAAAWYVLATIADDIVERFERMPFSAGEKNRVFEEFSRVVRTLDAAEGGAADLYRALNRVAQAGIDIETRMAV